MTILLFLYVLLPLTQIVVYVSNQWVFGPADTINFTFSIAALHWLLAQSILAAKIPWMQRSIPYDRRITFHILASIGIVVAVSGHALFKTVLGNYFNLVTWILLSALLAFFVLAVLWIPLPGFRRVRSWVLGLVLRGTTASYDRSKTVHRVLVHAITVLLAIHVWDAGLWYAVPVWSAVPYVILFVLSFSLPIASALGIARQRARVVSVHRHDSIIELSVNVESSYRYRAGQFAFLRVRNAAGRWEEHPFSFLTAPRNGDHLIRFGIRALGDFSAGLAGITPGTEIQLSRAFGDFRPSANDAAPLCLIGSGIGTVPILSLLRELSEVGPAGPIVVFLAVDKRNQILDAEWLETLAVNTIDVRLFVYDEDGVRFSEEFFRSQLPDADRYSYYLCSSPALRHVVTGALGDLGVPRRQIHFEKFSFG